MGNLPYGDQTLYPNVLHKGFQHSVRSTRRPDNLRHHLPLVPYCYPKRFPALQTFRFQLGPNDSRWALRQSCAVVRPDWRIEHYHRRTCSVLTHSRHLESPNACCKQNRADWSFCCWFLVSFNISFSCQSSCFDAIWSTFAQSMLPHRSTLTHSPL